MVTAELKAPDMLRPSRFAKQEQLNRINQYLNSVSGISSIRLPTTTKQIVCMAEIINITPILANRRSEEHTSELQSRENLVCRLQLEKKKKKTPYHDRKIIGA